MPRSTAVLATVGVTAIAALAACTGFKDAMSAHVDVVARAGPQELSVSKLGTLIGESRLPIDQDGRQMVFQLASLWVDYELLGHAAALNDSLTSPQVEDTAMWGMRTNARAKKWYAQVSKEWSGADTGGYAAAYASGKVLAARHILLMGRQGDTSKATSDSVHRAAVALRATLTPANFAQAAQKNSKDPGSAPRGGDLGVFEPGQMVGPFEQGLVALKPGQISAPVRSQFGWHIIYRPTYAEAHEEVARRLGASTNRTAESTYVARIDASANFHYSPGATATVRAVTKDPDGHRGDKTPIATYAGGDFTAGRLARWMGLFPPQMRQQLEAAPDSQIPLFVRNVVRNEMVLRQADSAKVTLDSAELATIRETYIQSIVGDWQQLNVDPKMLADSDKTESGRDKLAAAHIDDYLKRFTSMQTRFVDVPQWIDQALRSKYKSEVNEAGVDRALAKAQQIRKASDSSRAAKEPPSAVPLPGGAPAAAGGAATKKP